MKAAALLVRPEPRAPSDRIRFHRFKRESIKRSSPAVFLVGRAGFEPATDGL
jgi:hypothetical protein